MSDKPFKVIVHNTVQLDLNEAEAREAYGQLAVQLRAATPLDGVPQVVAAEVEALRDRVVVLEEALRGFRRAARAGSGGRHA